MSVKKCIALFLSVCLLVCGVSSIQICAAEESEDVVEYSTFNNIAVNESTGEFTVTDSNGYVWQSNPIFGGFDDSASGLEKTNQRSQMLVQYLDTDNNINDTNTFVDADRIVLEKAKNGVRLVYVFSELGFIIPLTLSYKAGVFTATVDTSKINERYDNKIINITVLPYFGAGMVGEDGYVLIPDGCGAIVSLDKNNAYTKSYQKTVYGDNPVLYKNTDESVEEQIYLPVFGVKRNQNSFLGIITKGDAISKIRANADSSYYTAAATFVYRQDDTSHTQEGSSREKEVVIIPKEATKSDFSVKYVFQQGENANYIGMANAYRNHLIKTCKLSDKEANGIAIDLSFTATAKIAKSFLGIPYTGTVDLTDFSDIENVVKFLKENNCSNYNLSLKGALGSGDYGKILNKVKINSKVGSYKEYKNLKENINKQGGNFYLLADFLKVYKTGNGVSSAGGTARGVSGGISKIYNFYPENFGKDESSFWRLINANSLEKVTESFAKSAEKKNISLGLNGMADLLYGDYRLNNICDRAEMLEAHKAAYKLLSEKSGDLYAQGANIYILPYADMISSIPTKSSQYDMFTADVPFYQAVVHGLVDYSSNPVNLSGEENYSLLKCIEYGSAVRYDLVCKNFDIIYETSEKHLFSSNADKKMSNIVNIQKDISDFYKANSNSNIVSHTKVLESVYCTEYSNGNKSIVNYSNNSVNIDGNEIKSGGYLLLIKEG